MILNYTYRLYPDADWFAVVAIESDLELASPVPHGHAIGVDVGLLSYVATSDSYIEPRPKFFKTAHRRLKVLQKRLSRKMKRGKNYDKARIKVAKQHNHIAFKRSRQTHRRRPSYGDTDSGSRHCRT